MISLRDIIFYLVIREQMKPSEKDYHIRIRDGFLRDGQNACT